MPVHAVLIISLILQLLAVYFLLRLIKITGKSLAWILIAAAITLLALHHSLHQSDLMAELIALAISALMAFGIERITPIAADLRSSAERQRESVIRYRTIFENSPISIWEEDFSGIKAIFDRLRREGVGDIETRFERYPETVRQCAELVKIIDVNKAALTLHGATSKEELLAGLVKTFTPESYETFRRELICLWRGDMEMSCDAVVKTLDGEPRHVTVNYAVCPGYEETLSKIFVSLIDITERKQAEAALTASEGQFRSLAQNIPDNIIRYDRQGRAVYLNPALEKLLGIDARERIGKSVREFHTDGSYESYAQAVDSVLANGEDLEFEFVLPIESENPPVYIMRMVAEYDEHGDLSGMLAISREITEFKRAEQERQAYATFLANMDRINRAIQGAGDLETMMRDVLDEVRDIFNSDGAYLLYPCDPKAASWSVPMESVRPEYPGVSDLGDIAMDADVAAAMELLVDSPDPVKFGPGTERPLAEEISARYGFKSFMAIALCPKLGKAWEFGVHQCAHDRIWTEAEERLLKEIGRRLTDALSSLLGQRHLRESEAKYRLIVDTAREGILTLDEHESVTFINAHMARMLGYSVDELQGRQVTDFMLQAELDDHRQRLMKRKQRLAETYERRLLRRDGKLLWALVSATPIFDGDHYRGALSMVTDITERKEVELQLKQTLEFTEGVINAIPDILIEVDGEGRYLNIWTRRPETLAAPKEELIGRAVSEMLPPTTAATAMAAIREADEKGISLGTILRFDLPQGTHWFEHSISKISSDDPTAEPRFLVLSRDVTERMRMEEELRASEQRFHAIFDKSFQFIGLLTTQGVVLEANRAALQFSAIEEPEVLGKFFWEAPWWRHSTEQQQWLREAIREAADGRFVRSEVTHADKDGRLHTIDFSLTPITDSEGRVIQLIPEGHDITEQKAKEDELRRYRDHLEEEVRQRTRELRLARDDAQAANKAKSVFLANMSHELRTPLNAILGFSHMMQQDAGLNETQCATLDIINNSGEHLLKLINDVLEIAKIEAGKLQLEIATFDLHALVREVSDMMRLRAQQKGLQLVFDQSSEFPRYIKSDEARLRQILVNLVSNGVKFTDEGGVTIRLGVEDNTQHHLLLEVEDSGPGISEEDQENLFQPFVQLPDGSMQGGTGLGLSIVQQFVMLMDGVITVESTPGKGSLFRVELPLETAEEADVVRLGEERLSKVKGLASAQPAYRILITEDQRDNQLLLVKLMNDIGLEVKVAENGEECLKIFETWRPDLIWMDRRMPLLDGVEATRRIRRMPGGDEVKIVAVTASAFKEQKEELLAAGMDDFVRKPFRIEEIYESLARQLDIEYIYQDDQLGNPPPPILTPQMMTGLDDSLKSALREALEMLDGERIAAIIRTIADKDQALAESLKSLAENFDYPAIMHVLEEVSTRDQRHS